MYSRTDVVHEIESITNRVSGNVEASIQHTYNADPLDRANDAANQEVSKACAVHDKKRLVQLRKTLKLMDNDTYGCCSGCGVDIPNDRLEINPSYTDCLECTIAQERKDAQLAA